MELESERDLALREGWLGSGPDPRTVAKKKVAELDALAKGVAGRLVDEKEAAAMSAVKRAIYAYENDQAPPAVLAEFLLDQVGPEAAGAFRDYWYAQEEGNTEDILPSEWTESANKRLDAQAQAAKDAEVEEAVATAHRKLYESNPKLYRQVRGALDELGKDETVDDPKQAEAAVASLWNRAVTKTASGSSDVTDHEKLVWAQEEMMNDPNHPLWKEPLGANSLIEKRPAAIPEPLTAAGIVADTDHEKANKAAFAEGLGFE